MNLTESPERMVEGDKRDVQEGSSKSEEGLTLKSNPLSPVVLPVLSSVLKHQGEEYYRSLSVNRG